MTPQQYERLTELFHAAMGMAQDERETLLDQISKSDPVLWRALKSMLAAHHLEAHTMERPDDIAAAFFLAQQHDSSADPGPLGSNTRLDRFQIRSQLGKGGMGEVYLAQDTRLHRYVALKILPAAVGSNDDLMRRFEQEAQATAALNHPNIAQIYEIGVADGVNFIVMELIEGVTLRAKIHGEHTELRKLLKYLQQVAEGLAKAHAAGIVHRDLKPDNIMITSDDDAKILDFGLAKLIEPAKAKDDLLSEAITRELRQHSEPGTVMGTVGYMSPEQVQGLSVDQRSDTFAFGCILYESVTRQQPFAGDSPIDSLHKIIYESPPPIKSLNTAAAVELQRIVGRCLRKDPEKRYQAINDVASDLQDLRRKMQSESEEQLSLRFSKHRTSIVSTGKSVHPETSRTSILPTTELDAARLSSAQGKAKRHRRVTAISIVFLIVVLAMAGYVLVKFTSRKTTTGLFFPDMSMTRLTSGGRTVGAAISPDGKYVAYVLSGSEKPGLWLKHLATMSDTQIVPAGEAFYSAPIFSSDGNYVYYVQSQPNNERGTMYRVGVLGGSSMKMIEDVDPSVIAFSPDGKKLAFLRSSISLMVANADGTDVRTLNRHQGGAWFGALAWSDNNMIATSLGHYTRESFYMNLSVVSAVNGEEHAISSQWPLISGLASLTDGSGLVMSAKDQSSGSSQIWQLYPTGEAHRVTNDLNDYFGISLTKDSRALVTVQAQTTSNIWIVQPGDESSAKQIITHGDSPSWTPDDKITYHTGLTGKQDLWLSEADGSGKTQMSFDENENRQPIVTPNNRYIVFNFFRDDRPFIGRIDRDGGNLKLLTSDIGGTAPFDISPDSMWVVYNDFTKGGIWKVSIDGGDPVLLSTGYYQRDFAPTISPNGKLIASYNRDRPDGPTRIAIHPFGGGGPIKILQLPWAKDFGYTGRPLRWTPDGRAVTYISARDDVFNLWNQPLDGSPPKQLTHFTSDRIFWFDWSRDGKRLVLARGTTTRNAILIKGNRI